MTIIARIELINSINYLWNISQIPPNKKPKTKKSFLKWIVDIITLKYVFLVLVWFYQLAISPLLPHSCIFKPSCSKYMVIAIKQYGLSGVLMGIYRIIRCNPFNHGGIDPVPFNPKGVMKWLY